MPVFEAKNHVKREFPTPDFSQYKKSAQNRVCADRISMDQLLVKLSGSLGVPSSLVTSVPVMFAKLYPEITVLMLLGS